MGFSALHNSQAAQLQLPSRAIPCGQQGGVLAAGLQDNLKNTSWIQCYESFTENTFTDEKHI